MNLINKKIFKICNKSGMSLVEVLVTIAIVLAFLSGMFAAFIQILKANDTANARMDAINNARSSLDTMSKEIKSAYVDVDTSPTYFIGVNVSSSSGDRIDNDRDGKIDEEKPNGIDDDGDWNAATDDNNVRITTSTITIEKGFGKPDLGDNHIDEDNIFNSDTIRFQVLNTATGNVDEIAYYIGTFQGMDNVLLREFKQNIHTNPTAVISPIAFDVLSINFLYWDANVEPKEWAESWDASSISGTIENTALPKFQNPIAVYITITINATTEPISTTQSSGRPFTQTITLSTLTNIEQMLNDARYTTIRNRE